MRNRLLDRYQVEKNRQEEKRRFRLFAFAQIVHYGTLLFLLLGGLFFIVFAVYAILK